MTFDPSSLWFDPAIMGGLTALGSILSAIALFCVIGTLVDTMGALRKNEKLTWKWVAQDAVVLSLSAAVLFGTFTAFHFRTVDREAGTEALIAEVGRVYGFTITPNIAEELAPVDNMLLQHDGTLWNLHHGLGDMKKDHTSGGIVNFLVGEREYKAQLVWHADEWRLVQENGREIRRATPPDTTIGDADGGDR